MGKNDVLALVQQRLKEHDCTNVGNDWTCPVPAHEDSRPSLTVKKGDKVPVVIACSKCKQEDVLSALGLTRAQVFGAALDVVNRTEYLYTDKNGVPLFRVVRLEMSDGSKSFRQHKVKVGGGWEKSLLDAKRVLYGLPELRRAIKAGHTIHLTEGEKDAEALNTYFKKNGVPEFATCHSGGAGKWDIQGSAERYVKSLSGATRTVIWSDRDAAGYADALQRYSSLSRAGRTTSLRLPIPSAPKSDAFDHLAAKHSPADGLVVTSDEIGDLLALTRTEDLGTWGAQDLSGILDGTYKPPQPTIGRRAGNGVGLFYPSKFHLLVSESEAGKTWLALHVARQEVEQGRHVYYFDFEDDGLGITGRLLAMGVDQQSIATFFHYARPDQQFDTAVRDAVVAVLRRTRASLVVVDGVTEVMSQHRWGQNANDDVAAFYQQVLRPMADTGAAVVALDHLPKSEEGTSRRGPIGGVHKLNGIDGAVYRLRAVREIAPGREGLSAVTVDKDRVGQVKKHQDDKKRVADLIVDSDESGVLVSLEVPAESARIEAERLVNKQEKADRKRVLARELLESAIRGEPGISKRNLMASCKGNGAGEELLKDVLAELVDPARTGSVVVHPGPNSTHHHYLQVDVPSRPGDASGDGP